jgi:hypothetical protein
MPAGTRSATLGLALVLLLLGCSSSQTATRATPRPSGSATPSGGLDAGWILHADNAGGFAVAFPDAWALAMSDSPTLSDDLAAIAAQQAELGAFFTTAFASSKTTGLVLLAADPRTVASGFTTNASVFRSDLGPAAQAPDLEGITQGKLGALNKDSTITGTIDRRHVQLGGQDASRIAYVFKSGGTSVEVASYLLVVDLGKNRLEYELTIGSAIADYAQLFDKVAATFVLGSIKTRPATPSPTISINPNGPGPATPSP